MSQMITRLAVDDLAFPSVEQALNEPNGLLAFGGDLSVSRLLAAYQQGIFPWFNEHEPIMWWSPDPRGVLFTANLNVNKSLTKFLKKRRYRVTVNQQFNAVIQACAHAPFRTQGTWISSAMQNAYQQLHLAGFAHSIEVWQQDTLVGGLYGVAINGMFAGESMFYQQTNASKVALYYLTQMLAEVGVVMLDCQLQNDFLASMGAVEISRKRFIQFKNTALKHSLPANFWQPRCLVEAKQANNNER